MCVRNKWTTLRVILDSVDSSRSCRGVCRWVRRVFFFSAGIYRYPCSHCQCGQGYHPHLSILSKISTVLYIPTATYATQDRNSVLCSVLLYTSTVLAVNCFLLVFVFYFLSFNYTVCSSRVSIVGLKDVLFDPL